MRSRKRIWKGLTEAVFDEVVEGVAIQVVRELVVGGGEFLEALRGDTREIALELGVLSHNHRSSGHEAVYQRLLPHLSLSLSRTNPKTECVCETGRVEREAGGQAVYSERTGGEREGEA